MEKEKKTMDKEEKKGIFFGIIGVLTLIIAIIGASFAYFSINARSKEDAVKVQAASVQIVYKEGNEINVTDIIPSSKEVALETQRRALAGERYDSDNDGDKDATYSICKDDNNRRVCGIYDFSLTNNSANPVDVMATVKSKPLADAVTDEETGEVITPAEKPFENLSFILFDRTGVSDTAAAELQNGNVINENGVFDNKNRNTFGLLNSNLNDTYQLPGNSERDFRLFIWLNAATDSNGEEIAQDQEQGAVFRGTIFIDVAGAENITGDASSTLG